MYKHRDHIQWEEDHKKQAEEKVLKNSMEKLSLQKQGFQFSRYIYNYYLRL